MDEAVVDMWTCMKDYRKTVIALGNELSLLGLTAQRCVQREQEFGQAVRHLFIASAQVLSHEKARICMVSCSFIQCASFSVFHLVCFIQCISL